MTRFLGTVEQKLDRKGRISIPSPFRAELAKQDTDELVLRPSHQHPCVEAWPRPAFDRMAAQMRFETFSDDADDMETVLFALSHPTRPDAEGRLTLPAHLAEHAGLTDGVAFVGRGATFQMWEPGAVRRQAAAAFARARDARLTLPAAPPLPSSAGTA